MRKRSPQAPALLLVLALAGATAGAQPALDTARLGAALAAPAVRHAEPVRAFYEGRGYRPMWTSGAGLSASGRALRPAIGRAHADGLDGDQYPLPALAEGGPPEAVEIAFSEALLRLSSDLARGRVPPARVHPDWDAKRRRLDAARVLDLAAQRGPEAALQAARPPHVAYARLREALSRYRALADEGGWPVMPSGPTLRLGDEDPAVPRLRERLALTGDGPRRAPPAPSERYDAELERAVRRFQARLGLAVDGVVGPATRAALNVPAAARARQIAVNMERWRWLPGDLGPTHLHVNVAGMWAELVEEGRRTLLLRTVVGTVGNPTPGFSSLITHAVLSPYWHVPESIARAEIWPQLARDPGYLARHHMRVLQNGRIRQDPGPDNPLGPVKFIFENRFGVRLHGTSAPALFDERVRASSHGCIRVEEPLGLAVRIIRSAGWDEAQARAAVERGEERWVRLAVPVPLHVSYWTAWVEADGTVQFRDDLYGRDRALVLALNVARTTRSRVEVGSPEGPPRAAGAGVGSLLTAGSTERPPREPGEPACALLGSVAR